MRAKQFDGGISPAEPAQNRQLGNGLRGKSLYVPNQVNSGRWHARSHGAIKSGLIGTLKDGWQNGGLL